MDRSSVYHVLDSTIRRNKVVLKKKKKEKLNNLVVKHKQNMLFLLRIFVLF